MEEEWEIREDAPDEDYCDSCGAYGPLKYLEQSAYNSDMLCGTCQGEEQGRYGHRWLKVKSIFVRNGVT